MIKVRQDLTGLKFGRLTVICQTDDYIQPSGQRKAQWICKCECGNNATIIGYNLTSNLTKSCGCLHNEQLGQRNKKYNNYNLDENIGIGYTLNTNNPFYFDLEDYNKIKNYCWSETTNETTHHLRAWIPEKKCIMYMHQLLGFANYDHIDRNELNNQKSNVRPCTIQENARNCSLRSDNTSGVTGVSFDKRYDKWAAYINIDKNKRKFLGYFSDKQDAISARLQAEKKYFKEFAPQQHLYELNNIKN